MVQFTASKGCKSRLPTCHWYVAYPSDFQLSIYDRRLCYYLNVGFIIFMRLFSECCRFCCLMAGAIYWAGLPQLWLSRFCSVSEPFGINPNVLNGSPSVKPNLYIKNFQCAKWDCQLHRCSVMMLCFLLEFKRQWENSHALPSETAWSDGHHSIDFHVVVNNVSPSPGHKVVVVRCEGINISGNFYRNKRT